MKLVEIPKLQRELHAIKLEDLEMTRREADKIIDELAVFLTQGLDYTADRVENLECRSRDGFMAYGHNKGGLSANTFRDQFYVQIEGGTGFKEADKTLDKYEDYSIEYFIKDTKLNKDKSNWTENDYEKFDEFQMEDTDSTVLFSTDLMLTSENELNIRMCVCVKDAPYHRQYDNLLKFDIKFKNSIDLAKKLNKLLKNKDVKKFAKQVREEY